MNRLPPLLPWDPADVWENYQPTALLELPNLATLTGVGHVFVKAEWQRPLGNFKALGGMTAGLRALARSAGIDSIGELIASGSGFVALPRLVCASDGNHGLAVTAAAARVGARATIYLPRCVGKVRADRIEALGGEVAWVSGTYDDAVSEAAIAAANGLGLLIPDTSSELDNSVVRDVMAGYALMTDEIVSQLHDHDDERPTHLFVQAGVGGLAAAMAEGLQELMQSSKHLVVVEPESAACVAQALLAGAPLRIAGDLCTSAEMLACGIASAPALEVLLRHDAHSVVVSEDQLQAAVDLLWASNGIGTTTSGAAGLAGLLHVASQSGLRKLHQLTEASTVLLVITEGQATGLEPTNSRPSCSHPRWRERESTQVRNLRGKAH